MNKYEKLIEYIINDESDRARELFHEIVVEKSRDIYESIMDDEEETVGGNPAEGLVDELQRDVQMDEEGISEEEDDMDMDADMGMDMDHDMDQGDDEMDHHADVGGEEALEDRVMDLEDALDELKAEFDQLMAGEEHEEEMYPGIHGDEDESEDEESEEDSEEDEELDETMVREYVERVGDTGQKSEGGEVGRGGKSASINKQSNVASKNDMGGSAKNIATGKANPAPDGQRPAGKASGFVKPAQELDVAKRNVNKPGGHGADKFYGHKETSWEKNKGAEGQTTDGKLPVSNKSLVGGKVR
jgi:hypothetical protein